MTLGIRRKLPGRAGKPMARGRISLALGIYCCPNFVFLLSDQRLYNVKNVYTYTYLAA